MKQGSFINEAGGIINDAKGGDQSGSKAGYAKDTLGAPFKGAQAVCP